MPRRWWDDPDDPLLDDVEPEPERGRSREAEPPRPELRRRVLPDVDPWTEEPTERGRAEERKARADASIRFIEREYADAGLTPPRGTVTSLSLLLRMGWTIGDDGRGGKLLLRPPEPPKESK